MSESSLPLASSTTEIHRSMPVYAARRPRPRYWLHALLFLLTCFTTLVVGARMQYHFAHGQPVFLLDDSAASFFPVKWALSDHSRLLLGIPFAGPLMLILMAHEMGHYLYCKHYGVWATLPFFIPAPTLIGTLGAFIRIRSPIRSRTALFDIGIAGPIAGFITAPAIAAWVGMFATALNLLPGGQLDGGHIVFSIAPRAHRWISWLTTIVLLFMAYYVCYIWLVWAILLRLSSLRHPRVAEWPRVEGSRAFLAGFAVIMLVLTLAPAPFLHFSIQDVLREMRRP